MNACFNYDAHATEKFWKWFGENNERYITINTTEQIMQTELFDELLLQLHQYCDQLSFEIGTFDSGAQDLVISADGNQEYFDAVTNLVSSAPHIAGWVFTALRPPVHQHFKAKLGKLELSTENLWFLPEPPEKDKVPEVKISIPNYSLIKTEEVLLSLLNKIISKIIGEKSYASLIYGISVDDLPDHPEQAGLWPILELHDYISWFRSTGTNG